MYVELASTSMTQSPTEKSRIEKSKTLLALEPTISSRIGLSIEQIADFCEKWQIASLDLFGSVLREDFRPDSDIDFLITYVPDAPCGLLKRVRMK